MRKLGSFAEVTATGFKGRVDGKVEYLSPREPPRYCLRRIENDEEEFSEWVKESELVPESIPDTPPKP